MFGRKIPLFRLYGFQVNVDYSWFFLLVLISWSLAAGAFPQRFPDLTTGTYWAMGLAGAFGLFGCIVLHEFAHSIVARKHGVDMKGITLFVFGGVAEMRTEPDTAGAEFKIAVAGPIASALIAAAAAGVYWIGADQGWPAPVNGVVGYLAFINIALVVFNLIPAFPLDGGRMFRAFLWRMKGDLKWATRVSAQIGAGAGVAFIVLGVFGILSGNFIGGLWWALIGMFLRGAASMSYQQLLMRRTFEGEKVGRFMTPNPISVSANETIEGFVEDYIYRTHHKLYPVSGNGRASMCITFEDVKAVPREEWARTTVGAIAHDCTEENTISKDADAMEALTKMSQGNKSRLLVHDNGELVGIIVLKDLLQLFSMKIELEEGQVTGRD